jgi:hypothetical protein
MAEMGALQLQECVYNRTLVADCFCHAGQVFMLEAACCTSETSWDDGVNEW